MPHPPRLVCLVRAVPVIQGVPRRTARPLHPQLPWAEKDDAASLGCYTPNLHAGPARWTCTLDLYLDLHIVRPPTPYRGGRGRSSRPPGSRPSDAWADTGAISKRRISASDGRRMRHQHNGSGSSSSHGVRRRCGRCGRLAVSGGGHAASPKRQLACLPCLPASLHSI